MNFAHPWAKLNFRLLIRSCCNALFRHHAQVTTKHSILNCISWSNLAHPFYLNFHGAFGLLLVLGGWGIERFIKHHLPIPCSKSRPEVFTNFWKRWKQVPRMILSFAQSVCTLTKAFVRLLSLTSKRLLWSSWYAEKLKHTCLKYFAKKKIGPKRINKSYNHDREVHVCGYVVDEMRSKNKVLHVGSPPSNYFRHG